MARAVLANLNLRFDFMALTISHRPLKGWRRFIDPKPQIVSMDVTTAWRVLRLRMEEWPPIWRVAVNKLNKQPPTADEAWSSSLGVGRGANNPSP